MVTGTQEVLRLMRSIFYSRSTSIWLYLPLFISTHN